MKKKNCWNRLEVLLIQKIFLQILSVEFDNFILLDRERSPYSKKGRKAFSKKENEIFEFYWEYL